MAKDKTKHNCSNCSVFGKHCPHKVNGDPYHYDCGMTVEDIEKENAELKKQLVMSNKVYNDNLDYSHHIEEQLTKAKVALRNVIDYLGQFCSDYPDCVIEAEQFISEVEK